MKNVFGQIRRELEQNVDEKTKGTGQNFFKEKVKVHGVKVHLVTKISKMFADQIKDEPKAKIFALCEKLWQSGYLEESFVACNLSYAIHDQYEAEDFEIFERWIGDYVDNWASCDTLCNHMVGEFIEMYPRYVSCLKKWAKSDNRWFRRASAVSLIIPARKGKLLDDILKIADILMHDEDDLVQKGYGWMLKAASEAHQKEIFDYVMKHKVTMPRTALRYAIEKMPPTMKAEAMRK